MRVTDFRSTRDGESARVSATITWEDCDRPRREIYIETHARFADDLKPDPNAFLLAAILPAMLHDERRILIEGSVCPCLRDGLLPAMQQLREWYGEETLIPVFTNMRYLDDDDGLFAGESHGASFAAIGQAFSRRLTRLLIPSTFTVAELEPWGSHPSLDAQYSSAALSVHHDGLRYSRLEKVELVAEWDEAMQTLRSCFDAFRSELNCGKSEKCVRTMTALLILGKLEDSATYAISDITPDMLRWLQSKSPSREPLGREQALREFAYHALNKSSVFFWRQLVDPLRTAGRPELAAVVEEKLREYENHKALTGGRGWKSAAKRFDGRYLQGVLFEMYRRAAAKR